MILVDTSVWIEVLRKEAPVDLEHVVPFDEVITCLPVVQEVLQGIRDERAFNLAKEAMSNLPCVEDPITREVFDLAVGLYRMARKQGLTVRSSVDCLIAACAIRSGAEVLHRDRDFAALARVSSLRERAP
ncbi:MAG: PIN domain-containing protein [Deltaproteobacteria bacterium]|nr:PIN domain-containing protein [Deltaproteobacteria bacterium]